MAQEEPALITLARFDLAMAAEQAKAALESKGIPAFALDSATIGMNPMLSWAAGGVRLQVPAMHATEARAFLNESGFLQVEEKPDFNQCPRCGSTAIKNHGRTKLDVILSVLVLGALLLFLKRAHTCRSCGHEWRA